jgi:phospholipid N-methyltransferase
LERVATVLESFMRDKDVASVVKSSKFTVKHLCSKIDFSQAEVIVEYGPGTGVFSKYMLKRMRDDSKLILIEKNKELFGALKNIKDKRLRLFCDSAENVDQILYQCKLKNVDYVISGIPFSFIPHNEKEIIISKTYELLSVGGKFLVYQFNKKLSKLLKKHFEHFNMELEIFNIPPLFIMEATKNE